MNLYFFSITLVILSNVFYHLFQKTIPANVNPIVSLIFTYGTALLASFIFLFIYPSKEGISASFRHVHWSSFALGMAVVGLEIGFLFAYRAGWNISLAALFANVILAVLLIPIGLLFYKESLNLTNVIGIAFSIIGIVLIAQR